MLLFYSKILLYQVLFSLTVESACFQGISFYRKHLILHVFIVNFSGVLQNLIVVTLVSILMGLMFLLLNVVSPLIDLALSPFLQSRNEKSLQILLIVPNEVCGEFCGASEQNCVLSETKVTLDGRPQGRRGDITVCHMTTPGK